MLRKTVSGILFVLLLVSVFTGAFNVQSVKVNTYSTQDHLPNAYYNEMMGLTLTQNFTSLAYNVTAVAQTDGYGYGPAYVLNGLTDQGYWYQVDICYNWPKSYQIGGYNKGFRFGYEVFDPAGNSIFPTVLPGNVNFSGPVNDGDSVLLALNFSSGNVTMYDRDWNTGSTAQISYYAHGATYFMGLTKGRSNSNGFFTGLMTEWYHVDPYYGDIQKVTYSERITALSSAWMWILEFNVNTTQPSLFSKKTLVVYSNPTQLQYFSSNGATECSNAYEFITGMGDWWMFHHDLVHSGYSTSTGPTTNNLLWTYTTGSYVDSSPAVAGGLVYVGSEKVYCLNAATGALVWNYTTGSHVFSSPAVADGKVYVGSGDIYQRLRNGAIYCLNASSGALIWNYTTRLWVESSPAVVGGFVYVGSDDNNVYCLNAATGALVWNYTTPIGAYVYSSPAVVGRLVYVGSDDGKVYCLNATSGSPVWNYTTASEVFSSPAVAGGLVYVGSTDYNVYCLNATSGSPVWSYWTHSYVESSPAVVNGVVYVGSNDGKIYAFGVHDVAVTNVASSKTVVGQGFSDSINVTVANQGSLAETFKVTLYANATSIASQNITLSSGNSATITFTWNTTGFAKGNYTIWAYAWPVQNETDTTDNNCADGSVLITKVGDLGGGVPPQFFKCDGLVNSNDLNLFLRCYRGQGPPDP